MVRACLIPRVTLRLGTGPPDCPESTPAFLLWCRSVEMRSVTPLHETEQHMSEIDARPFVDIGSPPLEFDIEIGCIAPA